MSDSINFTSDEDTSSCIYLLLLLDSDETSDSEDSPPDGSTSCDSDDIDEDYSWMNENDDYNMGFNPIEVSESTNQQVLSLEDIKALQDNLVSSVSALLNIPLSSAAVLLRIFKWDSSVLVAEFERLDTKLYIQYQIAQTTPFKTYNLPNQNDCLVCFDDSEVQISLECNHRVCKFCWTRFLQVNIQDGVSCLNLTCPGDSDCHFLIDQAIVNHICPPELVTRYQNFLVRSFADDSTFIKWCPAPGCNYAVKGDISLKLAKCKCGESFCFQCSQEDHRPADCAMFQKWKLKEKDESETANWIASYTKDCPKCSRAIEKNGGCNHMTCRVCKHEFCWICLGNWSKHSSKTGGFYNCNVYKDQELAEIKSSQARARQLLKRYLHYFHRYQIHRQSVRFEHRFRLQIQQKMRDLQGSTPEYISTEFLLKAANQLTDCRARLAMSYVFAYFLKPSNFKQIFEDQQDQLSIVTEELSELLEKSAAEISRHKIVNLTANAKKRLDNLLDTVEMFQNNASYSQ